MLFFYILQKESFLINVAYFSIISQVCLFACRWDYLQSRKIRTEIDKLVQSERIDTHKESMGIQ